jgi:hypothetical protein
VRTEDEERRNRIKRLEDVVRRHKEELENPPPIEDAEVIAEEMVSDCSPQLSQRNCNSGQLSAIT